jgi:hypothetical protein
MCGCRSVVLTGQSLNSVVMGSNYLIFGDFVLYWWCLDRSKRNESQSGCNNRKTHYSTGLLWVINRVQRKLDI